MAATDDSYALLGFTPCAATVTPELLRQACYDAIGVRTTEANFAQIRIAYAVALHTFETQEKAKVAAENAYKILVDNPCLCAGDFGKENRAAQLPPRVRQRFLIGVAQVTNDPDMWTLMPGTTDDSVWKIILHGNKCPEIQQDADRAHAILCRNAANSETASRQLHYWGFKNLNKKMVYKAKIEITPGHFVTARYAEFTHVPKPGHEHGLWSNARGYPSPNHHRLTRQDVVPVPSTDVCCKRKRDSDSESENLSDEPSSTVCCKRKRDSSSELDSVSDQLLQTLTATYDAELDKQEESMDCILHTLDLDADTCNFSAEMGSVFEGWLDF